MDEMKQYSKPNYPAENAWQAMQEMLDKEMPVKQEKKRRVTFFLILGLISLSAISYLLMVKNNDTKNVNENLASSFSEKKEKPVTVIDKGLQENYIKKISIPKVEQNAFASANQESKIDNSIENNNNFANDKKFLKTALSHKKITKKFNKISSNKNVNYSFNNRSSFNDLRMMKMDRGEIDNVVAAKTSNHSFIQNDVAPKKEITGDESKVESITKATTSTANNSLAKTPIKIPKNKIHRNLHYGLQWNILLPQPNNYLDLNAKSQPLSLVVPEFWVSKNIGRKSELGFQLNPYSQYTLKSNNVLSTADYSVSILQGSTATPTVINYIQTRSLLKAMGVELTAKYTHRINDKFSAAIGIGNTWLNAAVVNDKLIGNNGKSVHDSLYGIAKGFKEWDYLKSSFVVGRLELLYQLEKFQIGVAFVKPIGNIYSFSNSNTNPINGRLVLRWKIK